MKKGTITMRTDLETDRLVEAERLRLADKALDGHASKSDAVRSPFARASAIKELADA